MLYYFRIYIIFDNFKMNYNIDYNIHLYIEIFDFMQCPQ